MSERGIVQTVCAICNGSCGMELCLEDDEIIEVKGLKEHPISQGYLCPKGFAVAELVKAPDRLKHPLRKIGDEQWQEITWNEAINLIAEKLSLIKAQNGAEAVAIHVGQTGVRKEFNPYVEIFCNVFGTPNFSSVGSHCHRSKLMANKYTDGAMPVPNYENSKCIVLWGYNPAKSCPPQMNLINKALQEGAKLIVIDPRATATAKKADIHLQLRPGTDGVLALSMLSVIVKENLYDRDFVDKWTIGFDKLAELVAGYPPEKVEKITWVPEARIKEAARLFAQVSPANISPGIGTELHTNGFQVNRAIAILQAITGNLDINGGAVFVSPAKLASPILKNDYDNKKPAIGQKEFPLFHKSYGHAQANIYTKAILEGEPYSIKGMVIIGSNPLLMWSNAGKVQKALASLDLLVVMDHFMTETAKLADIVLPATTFLGRNELWNSASVFGVSRIGLAPKLLEEPNCLSEWQFISKLARHMGYEEAFPWENEEEAINFRLQPLNLSVEELLKMPAGYTYEDSKEKKYQTQGFKTPSGKVELYSKELQEYGYDPLPSYEEPSESPESAPETAKNYPLILTTGARYLGYFHSRYRNLPSLRKLAPEPYVEVHKDKAKELGINEGEMVIVDSLRGAIEVKVTFTDEIDPRVIFISHGWDISNVNILTDNEFLDPVSGFPPDRALMVRIVKKGELSF